MKMGTIVSPWRHDPTATMRCNGLTNHDLATDGTIHAGVYQKRLAERATGKSSNPCNLARRRAAFTKSRRVLDGVT
jgi:hypothetical protein